MTLPPLRMDKSTIRTARSTIRTPVKRADRFYQTPAWRGLMKRIKAVRGCACEICGRGGPGVRIFGDHIVEIKDGGALLDAGNVMLLCGACHSRKTAKAKAARAADG